MSRLDKCILLLLVFLGLGALVIVFLGPGLVTYGDAESHLNISKRVLHGLTPGFAQLGGVWLPLLHLLMLPFIWSDYLWRTGLAGALVSIPSYILLGYWFFKLLQLHTTSRLTWVLGFGIVVLNPNLLYMSTLPMTESLYLALVVGSVYFLARWWQDLKLSSLIFTSILLGLATLARYESWFLTVFESLLIIWRVWATRGTAKLAKSQALLVIHGLLAYAGIAFWLLWCWLILGNPLYFSKSQYSSASQQQAWIERGQLLSYHSLPQSVIHFVGSAHANWGLTVSVLVVLAVILLVITRPASFRWYVLVLLLSPTIFSLVSLYLGQSIILVPGITPESFLSTIFNIRYGLTALPLAAYLTAVGLDKLPKSLRLLKLLMIGLILTSYIHMLVTGNIITFQDGTVGLSASRDSDAQMWLRDNYTGGKVWMDDYARSASIIRLGVRMQDIIYIGNKPFWDESQYTPQKYADWIIVKTNDAIDTTFKANKNTKKQVDKYFDVAYSSPDVTIYRKKN